MISRRLGVLLGGGARPLGGRGQGVDRRPGVVLQTRALLRGRLGDGFQGQQRRLSEFVLLGPGGLRQVTESLRRRSNKGPQAVPALDRLITEFRRRLPGVIDKGLQGRCMGFGLPGEHLVVRLQRAGERDQRGPLFGEAAFHRSNLLGDAGSGRLQARDMACQVFAGRARCAARLARSCGKIGRAGGQDTLGLVELGVGELGRFGDHPGLLLDRLQDPPRLRIEGRGQSA